MEGISQRLLWKRGHPVVPTKELQPFRTSTRRITRHKINPPLPTAHVLLAPSLLDVLLLITLDQNVLPARAPTFAEVHLCISPVWHEFQPRTETAMAIFSKNRDDREKNSRASRIFFGGPRFENDKVTYIPVPIINPSTISKNIHEFLVFYYLQNIHYLHYLQDTG